VPPVCLFSSKLNNKSEFWLKFWVYAFCCFYRMNLFFLRERELTWPVINGWLRASSAVIRCAGLTLSILEIRSTASSGVLKSARYYKFI
jgi:hypothetical protein